MSRAIASWPTWPGEPGFPDPFDEFLAQRFPTLTAADFAVLEAGIVSEETYVEQGLYWATAHHPIMEYILDKYQPDLALVGFPGIDEFQHQFMGLVSPTLPGGAPNPAYDDVQVNGTPDGPSRAARSVHPIGIRGSRRHVGTRAELARGQEDDDVRRIRPRLRTAVPCHRREQAARRTRALSTPQTGNCRLAAGETKGSAKACWAGGTLQIYLNVALRDPQPAPPAAPLVQIPANQVDAKVAEIRAKYDSLADPNDWTGDGVPEGWNMIDRMYSKAEARFIPNGPGTTADMAYPSRTGDLVVFSYPPYQFDAATPNTLVARSAFFGQHGYVPDVQDLPNNINMRATFIAGGQDIKKGQYDGIRSIDIAPTIAYIMGIPEPQHSQGRVAVELTHNGNTKEVITIIGLNDFHGQLEPTTATFDGLAQPVGGAAFLGTMFDLEKASNNNKPSLILAGGDNVGASPPESLLLEDMPAIDVENAWPLNATSYGNHEFDFGVERLLRHQDRANFPFLGVNIIDEATGQRPPWVTPSVVFDVGGKKIGVIGAALETTPELVAAGNTEGLVFLPAAPALHEESERLRRKGVRIQIVVIHEGASLGANRVGANPAAPWQGPIIPIAEALQDTSVDAIVAGHTHRVTNTMVGKILVTEGVNAGGSYSVLQLVVPQHDVEWVGGATRIAKTIGLTPRADIQPIIDQAKAETAPLRNVVIGSQQFDIVRVGARNAESAMGNLVADAMVDRYAEAEAAITNSGGLRQDLLFNASTGGEAPGQVTWGEMFAVLPFGNATVIFTLTGAQLQTAFLNGFSAVCNPQINTGRFPQVSGLQVNYHCNGSVPVVDSMFKAPPGGPLVPIGPADTIRIVTNDFMYTGGDGYTVFAGATDVKQTGDLLLDAAIDYVAENSPVAPVVEGRIIRQP